jgi:hypothetical protein
MDKTGIAVLFGISFFILTITGTVMPNIILIVLGLCSLITMIVFVMNSNKDSIKKAEEEFSKILQQEVFIPNKKVLSQNLLNGLAINKEIEQFAYARRYTENDDFKISFLDFNKIVEAKIITNYDTITSTSTGSVLTRGMIGTLLFGGVGGMIGGITASKTSSQKVKELTLEFILDDVLNTRYTLTFYNRDVPLNQSSPLIQEIEDWYQMFNVIIKRNNKEVRSV